MNGFNRSKTGAVFHLARTSFRSPSPPSTSSGNPNPPILHRKEQFLPPDHPRRTDFAALTAAEEAADLYDDTTTIGFKLNWERLLAQKRLVIAGHHLRHADAMTESAADRAPVIMRHKTAMTRYELSKPVKTLIEYGLLRTASTFFDYGCGQGSDVRGFQSLGHAATGWDPVHQPQAGKQQADIVNLGYGLNVIEAPAERVEALIDAYRHAQRLLVISGLIRETVELNRAAPYRRRNRFRTCFRVE